jgi:large subunit ribosomal protein L13
MEHVIDAKGRTIGRVATEAAMVLLGKDHPTTAKRNAVAKKRVRIINASAVRIPEKKEIQKTYYRHTGYPGGDRKPSLKQVIEKKGKGSVLRTAIYGMLPKNTLRDKRMKQLIIEA